MTDELDDMTRGDDDGDSPKAQPTLWVTAVCANSVELRLRAEKLAEPALQIDPDFTDEPGAMANPVKTWEPPEATELRSAIAAQWLEKISLARSLGSGAT